MGLFKRIKYGVLSLVFALALLHSGQAQATTSYARSFLKKGETVELSGNMNIINSPQIKDTFGLPLEIKQKGKKYVLVRIVTVCAKAYASKGNEYSETTQQGEIPSGVKERDVVFRIKSLLQLVQGEGTGSTSEVILEGAYIPVSYNIPTINFNKFKIKGKRLAKINKSINAEITPKIFNVFFSFLIYLLTTTKNILPPSTGPRGNKLKSPTPILMLNNQKNNIANHPKIG